LGSRDKTGRCAPEDMRLVIAVEPRRSINAKGHLPLKTPMQVLAPASTPN
jgi:hypothetical protein